MAGVIWSPRAIQDLDEICEYISKGSPRYAKIFAQCLVKIVERLPDHPLAGSIVPEYARSDLRERFLHSYRIVYRLRGDKIELVTICHGARLLAPDLL
jgi:addiction module RelE/StbE family toxin